MTLAPFAAGLALLAGCSKTESPVQLVQVAVAPSSATLAPAAQKQFTAEVTGAVDVSVTWSVDEHEGGAIAQTGLYTAPASTGTFHVRAAAHADPARSAAAEVRVVDNLPVILAFAASPAAIAAGASSTLSWSVTGATSLSIDNGVGAVTGASVSVSPAASTLYTLTAANSGGQTAASATVTVMEGAYVKPGAVTGDVVVAMDSSASSPISPYVYGLNFAEQGGTGWSTQHGGGIWGAYLPKYTLNRFGGNRMSGHNWETGYSNCGNDCGTTFPNDTNLLSNMGVTTGVGRSVQPRADFTLAANAAFLVTAPIIGYAARDASGAQPIPVAPSATTPATPDPAHWLQALPHNPGGATATPDTADAFVYTDDLAKWIATNYAGKDVQLELDNEPDIWFSTHQEIRGTTDGLAQGASNAVPTGFDELISKTIAHATAVKGVSNAPVWAGGIATWDGLVMLNYPRHTAPPPGYTYYLDYFLKSLHDAGLSAGMRLVDVFDVHWYVQDGNVSNDYLAQTAAVIDAREQAPRSLWDPDYIENSWVAGSIPSADPMTVNCRNGRCPIRIIPRLQSRIDSYYPGTKLAIGEYYYGRSGDISGAIAQADALGIFGRTGIYAATLWPNAGIWSWNVPNGCNGNFTCTANAAYRCALKAFDVFRNYDGAGAKFGDTSIAAVRSDPAFTSPGTQNERMTAYASVDAGAPGRAVIVAISKLQSGTLNAGFQLRHTAALGTVEVWRLTGTNGGAGGCTGPTRLADVAAPANAFNVTLPPQSITVLVMKP